MFSRENDEYKGYDPTSETAPLIGNEVGSQEGYLAVAISEPKKEVGAIKAAKTHRILPGDDDMDNLILSFLPLSDRSQIAQLNHSYAKIVANTKVKNTDLNPAIEPAEQKTFKESYGQISHTLNLKKEAKKALREVEKIDEEIIERNARAIRLTESNPTVNRQNLMQAFIVAALSYLFYRIATASENPLTDFSLIPAYERYSDRHCSFVRSSNDEINLGLSTYYTVCDRAPYLISPGVRLALLFGLLLVVAAVFKIRCFSSGNQRVADLATTERDRFFPPAQTLEEKRDLASKNHEELRLAANSQPLDPEFVELYLSRRSQRQAEASRASRCVIL